MDCSAKFTVRRSSSAGSLYTLNSRISARTPAMAVIMAAAGWLPLAPSGHRIPLSVTPRRWNASGAVWRRSGKTQKNDMLARGYLYVILGIVTEHISLEETDAPIGNDLSCRLLFYLNSHYRQDISLNTLSAEFGYSPSHLSRYFKSCFGVGVGQYVNLLRLHKALLLMQETRHSHTYCALESGFSSLRTFYRAFQKEFGCAPGEYLRIDPK